MVLSGFNFSSKTIVVTSATMSYKQGIIRKLCACVYHSAMLPVDLVYSLGNFSSIDHTLSDITTEGATLMGTLGSIASTMTELKANCSYGAVCTGLPDGSAVPAGVNFTQQVRSYVSVS